MGFKIDAVYIVLAKESRLYRDYYVKSKSDFVYPVVSTEIISTTDRGSFDEQQIS